MKNNSLKCIADVAEKLRQDPEELKAFLQRVMGPPSRRLEGKEKNDIILLLAMLEPFNATNNQHSWTDYYMIGETEYHVTNFPDSEVIIEEMLKEE